MTSLLTQWDQQGRQAVPTSVRVPFGQLLHAWRSTDEDPLGASCVARSFSSHDGTLFEAADKALHLAKQTGRVRVCTARDR